ncbi:PDZ domain-containing protein [Planctomicrobium sp. SH527]|uniref:PDZ domain-containing protein n=1 Tax=Planctomicrobium sp. SH527 TaxID=3448123 RepID=UPI003F5C21E2
MIKFNCNGCGVSLKAPESKAGASFPCPKCQSSVTVPGLVKPQKKSPTEVPAANTFTVTALVGTGAACFVAGALFASAVSWTGSSSNAANETQAASPAPVTDQKESISPAPNKPEQDESKKWIGVGFVTLADVRPKFTDSLGIPLDGVVISTGDETPARDAGMVGGDIIVEIGGKKIATAPDFERWFKSSKIGETYPVRFYAWSREGRQKVFREMSSKITVGTRDNLPKDEKSSKGMDVEFANLILDAIYDLTPKRLTPTP